MKLCLLREEAYKYLILKLASSL
ncbi:hypothetical protein FOXB_03465 [Fusarium oxysporum f. sp. conglutinans Fo5176]|uniref:Uncharacterized protein n=1 Tax=Fusarium oxysporum (strain Fo5176) TaxID=660025 RepID=F9FAN9_FUSOF|nr:hypothetical protein FOXB_03465 [Fusarium oxysporum f. sp. conglutinans Fo5176]